MEHRIAITGASSTLAQSFLRAAAARFDAEFLLLARESSHVPEAPARSRLLRVDALDRPRVGAELARFQPTVVVHCAAAGTSFPRARWFDMVRFNVNDSVALCECVAALPGCQLLYLGTGLAYRSQERPIHEQDPLDTSHPYGASKGAADLLIRAAAAEFAVPLTVLRPFSFTGPGDLRGRLFPSLLRAATDAVPLPMTDGTQVRDHCSVLDVAEAMVRVVADPLPVGAPPRVLNLGSGEGANLRAVVERVVAEIGLRVELEFGAREPIPFEPRRLVADTSLAEATLGWRPRHNLAHAVWMLARASFPHLAVREPARSVDAAA